jgi:hypothetical protein
MNKTGFGIMAAFIVAMAQAASASALVILLDSVYVQKRVKPMFLVR